MIAAGLRTRYNDALNDIVLAYDADADGQVDDIPGRPLGRRPGWRRR